MSDKIPRALVTGMGSLPYREAQDAINLVFKYFPDAPFWPQLPQRGFKEGMIAQFSENFPFLKVNPSGIEFSESEEALEEFYAQLIANNQDYFRISEDFAAGLYTFYNKLEKGVRAPLFIKCQVTGPFTFAGAINDNKGLALLHNKVFMQAIIKGLAMKARWQISFFKKFGRKMLMFIDEPYLAAFGSAYTQINRQDVVAGLGECARSIKSEGVLIGVHCCGNTDWSMFTDIADIDIISFDAYDYLDKLVLYSGELGRFLKRGGILCWGIVPTTSFSREETKLSLSDIVKKGLNKLEEKGLPRDLLTERFFISPTCGLGMLTPERTEQISALLSETSSFIRDNPRL
ncbi:MAG: hypothetical protein ABSB18_00030 [Candidatus Omnitrophota bacterium]